MRARACAVHAPRGHACVLAHACVRAYVRGFGARMRACVCWCVVGAPEAGGSVPCVWEVCAPWRRGLFGPAAVQILPVSGHREEGKR